MNFRSWTRKITQDQDKWTIFPNLFVLIFLDEPPIEKKAPNEVSFWPKKKLTRLSLMILSVVKGLYISKGYIVTLESNT